ncbi:hypothetical protein B0H14DRAFT_2331737 [Mycena olivaceomarginata]|nr:hypothetical protein B0H14DRAFT_2331737 [Mycena olivaceomarginata]
MINILHGVVALGALHDSAESFPQPRCHPETRTKMINDLYRWVTRTFPARPIHWLYGPAGSGKSAIVQTLCRRLQEEGRLGGSFFFKRDHSTCGNAKVLFATLAYQLTVHDATLKDVIACSIKDDSPSVGRDMDVQLMKLIVEPSSTFEKSAPLTLLIDGLDECDSEQAQRKILSLIGHIARKHPSTFRFLIASRPEAHICKALKEDHFSDTLDCTNVEQSFEDVRTYLRDEFNRIYRDHPETMGNIPKPWPPTAISNFLVDKSSGYFIYASTIIKFIDDEDSRPTERLALVQNLVPDSDSDRPFAALDQLYTQILSRVPVRYHDKLCAILCARDNFELSIEQIEQLLELAQGDVMLILHRLQSFTLSSIPFISTMPPFLIFYTIQAGRRCFISVYTTAYN